MKPVQRSEIIDYVTYEEGREEFRQQVMEVKSKRRVHIGDYFTLLFENPLTVRYQVQEMVRTERLVKEAEIKHELETYNELLGGSGEFGCTLLIEIDDINVRNEKLREWRELPAKIYLALEDGTRIPATSDERQHGENRLSSVLYLKFDTGGRIPVAAGVDLPQLSVETPLNTEQQQALREDIAA